MRNSARYAPQRRRQLLPIRFSTLSGGVMALAAAAVGAALFRVVLPTIVVNKARFGNVEVDTLTVRKLHILEPDAPKLRRSRAKGRSTPVTPSGVSTH